MRRETQEQSSEGERESQWRRERESRSAIHYGSSSSSIDGGNSSTASSFSCADAPHAPVSPSCCCRWHANNSY